MSTVTLQVPKEYGYVVLTTSASFVLAFWHGFRIGPFRRAAGIPYPQAYAPPSTGDANPKAKEQYLFNCAQRAHGNFLENYPMFLAAILIAGLKYPLASTGLGVGWLVGRLVYALGYTRADKDKGQGRLVGSFFWAAQFCLMGLAGKVGYDMTVA